MVHIKIKKGLDIPIKGRPRDLHKGYSHSSDSTLLQEPSLIGLDLTPFDDVKFRVLVRLEETVKIGQPLVEDKETPGRFFVSPAGGVIREIRRGLKRRLLDIVIETAKHEESEQHPILPLEAMSRKELVERLKLGGVFAHIRQRPFNFLAHPDKVPRSIFVKAIESAPFTPPAEMQVAGYEKEFQYGLDALAKMTDGPVHLVYRTETTAFPLLEAKGVEKHTAEGPHPIANASVHIQHIDPIRSADDIIWTLDARTVVAIGYFLLHGKNLIHRVISVAGPGIIEGREGYFVVREGFPISKLIANRLQRGHVRLISGDPLMGRQVGSEDFLGFYDTAFCAIAENTKREFMHFFRLGAQKYSFSRAYLSGHLDNEHEEYDFTTNQHGEHRPFIDNTLYDDVMPLDVSTIHLVKAVMAEDFDLAADLGLLEVDAEDFALPSFVDPSKIEMNEIIKGGLRRYAATLLK
jgi:Na+-transporting NADH:ubiquinone oxidoreductase subunit A